MLISPLQQQLERPPMKTRRTKIPAATEKSITSYHKLTNNALIIFLTAMRVKCICQKVDMPTEAQTMWLVNQVRREGKLNEDLIGVEIFVIAFLYSFQITFTNKPLRHQQHWCLAGRFKVNRKMIFPQSFLVLCEEGSTKLGITLGIQGIQLLLTLHI